MTPKEKELIQDIKNKLLIEAQNGDTESAHSNADELLCELLNGLGLTEITEIYNSIEKWYA